MENKNKMSIIVAILICLVLVAVLVFISLNKEKNMNPNKNTASTSNTILAGDTAQTGDTVSMNYTGRLLDGKVFDSNVDPKFGHVEPFIFTLGAQEVIAGWDKGIVGMKVGEKKTLTIGPTDAYGAVGVPGVIPPNATLIFDVELVAINR